MLQRGDIDHSHPIHVDEYWSQLNLKLRKVKVPPGASTVKWTTLIPCIGLNENDLKLYNSFEFGEGKNHNFF